MAEDNNPGGSGLTTALPVTVVLAMLAGLFLTHSLPYQDERPSNHPVQARYAAAQDVDARLWQDPFAAVDNAGKETPTILIEASRNGKTPRMDANASTHTSSQIYNGENVAAGDEITVLAVTLPGGPYQEAAEQRMRWRYAVLSALANQGATPHDEQHIGYFQPEKSGMVLPEKVAFEWWSLPDEKPKVLLLWADESSLFGQPAAKLQELLCQASHQKNLPAGINFNYAVIGPNSSTLLWDMLKETVADKKNDAVSPCAERSGANGAQGKQKTINGHDIIYYSAGATASDKRLLQGSNIKECATVSECLGNRGITLYRTSATDKAMMAIVAEELLVRNVKKSDQIVILSEWDTFYGRAMPKSFKTTWDSDEQNVRVYSYMRGLDGKLPDKDDKTNKAAEKKSDSQDKSGADALIEFPEGQNQKDYLRRLTNKIFDLDQQLKAEGNEKGVAAIGVLGSDVHDKLMILEALRQHFPHKLFFTTDLDAAYSHPAKWPQTHNLLVASAFGLELRPELQGEIPPFRDSYQTAFFLTTQLALKSGAGIETLPSQFELALFPNFQLSFIADTDAASNPPPKWSLTYDLPTASAFDLTLHLDSQDKILLFRDRDSSAFFLSERMVLEKVSQQILPRLFEIGRSRPVPIPTSQDTVTTARMENDPRCSWSRWLFCNTMQPNIFSTSQLHWTWGGMKIVVIMPLLLFFVSWRARERMGQFMIGVTGVLLPATCLLWVFAAPPPQLHWIWGVGMVAILFSFVSHWVLESVIPFKRPFYFGLGVGVLLLFITYYCMPLWNNYITQLKAEPFYWHEGVSIWPSQLLRLLACLCAAWVFYLGRRRIKKMQQDLQAQRGAKIQRTFALPAKPVQFVGRCDVLFIGSWKPQVNNKVVIPSTLWKKYLGYCQHKKAWISGWIWRVIIHGVAFFAVALLFIATNPPNVPARGDFANDVNSVIIGLAAISTIMLTMWVVENARLCERLITHLSDNPSRWHKKARDWAIHDNNIAPECVEDWLDIRLVARLTATMQPLIWGPMVCIALLVLARSPVIDDWGISWGLEIVFIAMLLYAVSAEVFLQLGAKRARTKAIEQFTNKIRAQRNLEHPNEAVIKRIETEIEHIRALRDGAFRPWHEWPLLQSFGGMGTLVLVQQYFAGM